MNIIQTNIPSVLIIEPRVFKDERGYFLESYSQREFDEKVTPILGHSINFVQDNESMSSYGVMRGLHYQRMPYTQSKLVRSAINHQFDKAILSEKDLKHACLKDAVLDFDINDKLY